MCMPKEMTSSSPCTCLGANVCPYTGSVAHFFWPRVLLLTPSPRAAVAFSAPGLKFKHVTRWVDGGVCILIPSRNLKLANASMPLSGTTPCNIPPHWGIFVCVWERGVDTKKFGPTQQGSKEGCQGDEAFGQRDAFIIWLQFV